MGSIREVSFPGRFVSAEASDSEEPGAGKPHAGIREGATGQPVVLPRWFKEHSVDRVFVCFSSNSGV